METLDVRRLRNLPVDVVIEILKRTDPFTLFELSYDSYFGPLLKYTGIRLENYIEVSFVTDNYASLTLPDRSSRVFPTNTEDWERPMERMIRGTDVFNPRDCIIYLTDVRFTDKFLDYMRFAGPETLEWLHVKCQPFKHRSKCIKLAKSINKLWVLALLNYFPLRAIKALCAPPVSIALNYCLFTMKELFQLDSPYIDITAHNLKKLEKLVRRWLYGGFPNLVYMKVAAKNDFERLSEVLLKMPARLESEIVTHEEGRDISRGYVYESHDGRRAFIGFTEKQEMHIAVYAD